MSTELLRASARPQLVEAGESGKRAREKKLSLANSRTSNAYHVSLAQLEIARHVSMFRRSSSAAHACPIDVADVREGGTEEAFAYAHPLSLCLPPPLRFPSAVLALASSCTAGSP